MRLCNQKVCYIKVIENTAFFVFFSHRFSIFLLYKEENKKNVIFPGSVYFKFIFFNEINKDRKRGILINLPSQLIPISTNGGTFTSACCNFICRYCRLHRYDAGRRK